MADPNNLLIHEHRLCLMLTCKAANTSIKWAVAGALGLEATHRTDLYWPTPNKADALAFRREGYLVVGFTRHPLDRLASLWADKVAGETFHQPFRRKYGGAIRPRMGFAAFVRVVAGIPDGLADQHFRSMSAELVLDGEVVPEVVIKVESPNWWDRFRRALAGRFDPGPERRCNASAVDRRGLYDAETRALAVERYAADFEAFGYEA